MRASIRFFLATALVAIAVTTSAQSPQSPPVDEPSILISRQLAESRRLKVGDTVRLSADSSGAHARPFRIAGIYEPTPDPMRFAQPRLEARLHLPDMLTLTGNPSNPAAAESITSINIALQDPADARGFA